MRPVFLSLLAGSLLISSAFADIVMVQNVEAMGQKMTMTLKVKGDLTRVDVNPQMSMIIDAKTGEMTNLMHEQKMFMKMNLDSMKGMMDQVAKNNPAIAEKPVVKATGNKEKINGHDTEEYIVTKAGTVSHLWVAKDFPNYQALVKATEAMKNGPLGKLNPQMQMDMSLLPGMPVKTVVESNGTTTATVLLESIEEKDLDPSEFTAPADYQAFQMPSMQNVPAPGQ